MSTFDDRERAFETKFAHDEEMKFRFIARRNRLLGEWAARKMGLSDVETDSYSKDVIRKVLGDLTSAGVDVDESEIRQTLEFKAVEAKRQLIEAQGGAA